MASLADEWAFLLLLLLVRREEVEKARGTIGAISMAFYVSLQSKTSLYQYVSRGIFHELSIIKSIRHSSSGSYHPDSHHLLKYRLEITYVIILIEVIILM